MKKEYHLTISRKDRIYLVLFFSMLLGWELIKSLLPHPFEVITEQRHDSSGIPPPAENGTAAIHATDDISPPQDDEEPETESTETITSVPRPTEIMKASFEELTAIGFSKKVAATLLNYIKAGGVIRDEKSLLKIYGVDSVKLQSILPLIIFPTPPAKESAKSYTNDYKKNNSISVIDLNLATAEELESLPGIGAILADRIIKFRTALGGFSTTDQIRECYGLPPETIDKVLPRLVIVQPLQQFSINAIDPASFSHPYLDKKILRMLPHYIRNHGPIKDQADLRRLFPPDTTWCDRLLPYVRFE